jgi:hypothetical protein
MSAPPPIAKKPRLIIINKDKAELRLSDCIVRHSPNSMAPSLGAPPLACTRFNNKTWQEYQDWLNANQQTYEHIYKRPLKCIYGAPREISHKKIPPQAKILVIEMNNDENKIMGIGEIINQTASEVYRRPQAVVPLPPASGSVLNPDKKPAVNKAELAPSLGAPPVLKYKIFSDRNYSRYIYIGNTRYATREELERNHTPDAQYINEQLANANTKMPQTSQQLQHPPTPLSMIETTERLLFKGPRHMKRGSGITKIQIHSEVSKTNTSVKN